MGIDIASWRICIGSFHPRVILSYGSTNISTNSTTESHTRIAIHCQLFYVFPVICYIKTRPDAKFSIVPEEGWFGQPKYSTRSKKHSTLCRFLPLYSSLKGYGNNQKVNSGRRVKAGVHLKAVFWLGIMFLMQISRLRFKQSRICSLITHIYVLRRFVNFLVIFRFIWRQIVFLKGLVKFMEIGNFEDLVLF